MPTLHPGAIEFVTVPLAVSDLDGPVPPSAINADIAFVPEGTSPVAGDWHDAVWDGTHITYLVAAADLGLGWHDAWVRIATGVETVIRRVRPGLQIE